MNLFGKVVEIKKDVQIPYSNKAGSYQGTEIRYQTKNGIYSKAFSSKLLDLNEELKAAINEIKEGDQITMQVEKKGQFTNVKSLYKGFPKDEEAGITTHATTGFKDNTAGLIKGNAVTNAVQLAIASSKGKDVTILDLTSALDKVLQLHAYAESLDILGIISSDKQGASVEDII